MLKKTLSYINFSNLNKVILFITIITCVYFLTYQIPVPDFDLWARLAVGSLFYQTGGVLKHDIFAYSPRKELWVDHEWGTGVLFYSIIRNFGDLGFLIFKALILILIYVLIIKTYRLYADKNIISEPLYFILLAYAFYPSLASTIRSQAFTFLFFIFWIYILERVRRGENRLLWIFPVNMLFWVNMHGGFVAGLGLLAMYAAGEFLNGKNPLKYIGILIVTSLVTFINPYGLDFWKYIYEATTLKRVGFLEWQPISLMTGPFHTLASFRLHILLGFMILAALTLLVFIRLLIIKRKAILALFTDPEIYTKGDLKEKLLRLRKLYDDLGLDWAKIIVLTVTFCLSIKYQRHCTFFVLAAAGLLYHQFAALFGSIGHFISFLIGKIPAEEISLQNVLSIWFRCMKLALVFGIIFFYINNFVLANASKGRPIFPSKLVAVPNLYPVGSLEFIKQNNLSGNLGITYNWGSYALWKLYPQCHVLMDGRYEEVYPNDIYIIALKYSEHVGADWYKFKDYFHTDIIVAPKSAYSRDDLINNLLEWQIVYEDPVSYLLLPKNKMKNSYIYPNANNSVYWFEDYTKPVNLN